MKQFYTTLLLLCFFFCSHAQQLLKDVYSSNGSTLDFAYSVTIGNTVYFTASSNSYGDNNLYKTDGTSAGTILLNTTASDSLFQGVNSLTSLNGNIIFKARDTFGRYSMFVSDGTVAGTVKIINNSNTISLTPLGVINNILYFVDYKNNTGSELWRTDGTSIGTFLVKDINVGTESSNISYFTVVKNVAYFQAYTNSQGYELWKSDGTEAGTVLIKDINPGVASSTPESLVILLDTIYFRANNGISGRELWKSDGTEVGTVLIKDINSGSGNSTPSRLINLGDKIFFFASNGNGLKLWSTNGTDAGTSMLVNSLSYSTTAITKLNNQLIFCANDGINGLELWRSDGTSTGTVLLKDVNLSSLYNDNSSFSSDPKFTVAGNVVYFWADNGINGRELWKTDGTTIGTALVKDLNNSSANSLFDEYRQNITSGNKLLFQGRSTVNDLFEMWISDGTEQGTIRARDINSDLGIELAQCLPFSLGNKFFFSAYKATIGHELYCSDGTSTNTFLLKDITKGRGTSSVSSYDRLITLNNLTFFTANDGKTGKELWVTDGTEANTFLYYDFAKSVLEDASQFHNARSVYPTYYSTLFNNFTIYNNELYWMTNGRFLWKTNGLSPPTKIFDTTIGILQKVVFGQLNNELYFLFYNTLYKGNGTSFKVVKQGISAPDLETYIPDSIARMIPLNGYLYFVSGGEGKGYELWRTDGTEAGTKIVKDINLGAANSNPYNLTLYNGKLYFIANNGLSGYELWQSDGTAVGTSMVIDLNPGSNNGLVSNISSGDLNGLLVVYNNRLYFSGTNGSSGFELWQSDGTAVGTVLVKDLADGSYSSYPYSLIAYKNKLFFVAGGLYKTDGTEAGTELVKSTLYPYGILVKGDSSLYFQGREFSPAPISQRRGYELYRSDGTEAGSVRLTDLEPVSNESLIDLISFSNNLIYFFMYRPSYADIGREPWIIRPDCPDEYSFSNPGETTPSGSTYRFKAAKRIEAFNTLQTNSNVVYQAANSLELKPGFSASNGVMFKAQIGGCDTDINALSGRTAVKDLRKLLTTPAASIIEEKEPMQFPSVEEFLRQSGGEEIRHLMERQRMAKTSYESLPIAERISRNPVREPNITIEYVRTDGDEKVFRMRVQLGEQLRELELKKRM